MDMMFHWGPCVSLCISLWSVRVSMRRGGAYWAVPWCSSESWQNERTMVSIDISTTAKKRVATMYPRAQQTCITQNKVKTIVENSHLMVN